VADLEDDFERESFGFMFKIIFLLSNAKLPTLGTVKGRLPQPD
jgi:hypothetical protein